MMAYNNAARTHIRTDAVTSIVENALIANPEEPTPVRLQRSRGRAEVGFHSNGSTCLAHLHQEGCCKVRLPKVYGAAKEAVFLNTAGGMTGGDEISYEASVGEAARAVFTTQACERIYRARDGEALVTNTLRVGANAHADWLPQETILFNGGRLRRRFEVDLASDAGLLAVEALILGREAMGETVTSGSFSDSWRIRRDGNLLFADEMRTPPAIAEQLTGKATLAGARAFATVVAIGGETAGQLAAVRALEPAAVSGAELGVSEVVDGLLVARLASGGGQTLRKALANVISTLRDGDAMPRVWNT